MLSSASGLAEPGERQRALGRLCLDESLSRAPLSSAPASPARLSPDTYIAMPSTSHGGVRPDVRLASAAWVSSWAIDRAGARRRSSRRRSATGRTARWRGDVRRRAWPGRSADRWPRRPRRARRASADPVVSALRVVLLRRRSRAAARGALTPGSPRFIRARPFSRSVIRLPTFRLRGASARKCGAACAPCSACTPTARARPRTAGRCGDAPAVGVLLRAVIRRRLEVAGVDAVERVGHVDAQRRRGRPSISVPLGVERDVADRQRLRASRSRACPCAACAPVDVCEEAAASPCSSARRAVGQQRRAARCRSAPRRRRLGFGWRLGRRARGACARRCRRRRR